jgi:hypothetical protein
MHDDKEYRHMHWNGGRFVFVTYIWKGGEFDDAVELERAFVKWGRSRNIAGMAAGRFPTSKIWQLGFIASAPLPDTLFDGFEFAGHKVDTVAVAPGIYASLKARGYPENMFFYWKKLKKWLERDGFEVQSPVYEIYEDLLDESLDDEDAIGEIRYKIDSNKTQSVSLVSSAAFPCSKSPQASEKIRAEPDKIVEDNE